MNKYRFKTEKEFIQDFGDSWRSKIICGWHRDMEKYFGQEIVMKEYFGQIIKSFNYEGWGVSKDMIIKVAPNYNPKQSIERTL